MGGLIHYRVKFPTEKKFAIAFTVYLVVTVLEGTLMYLPIPLMAAAFFFYGLLGVTSYNIRIAATQSYIPDTKRARFNGTFQMLSALGGVAGTLLAGSLAEVIPERQVVLMLSAVTLCAVGRWPLFITGRFEKTSFSLLRKEMGGVIIIYTVLCALPQ